MFLLNQAGLVWFKWTPKPGADGIGLDCRVRLNPGQYIQAQAQGTAGTVLMTVYDFLTS